MLNEDNLQNLEQVPDHVLEQQNLIYQSFNVQEGLQENLQNNNGNNHIGFNN